VDNINYGGREKQRSESTSLGAARTLMDAER
jgi:hypothetical protein